MVLPLSWSLDGMFETSPSSITVPGLLWTKARNSLVFGDVKFSLAKNRKERWKGDDAHQLFGPQISPSCDHRRGDNNKNLERS